jgi:transcriptional repressor NrdR
MRCPACNRVEDRVLETRASSDGDLIRRRRECLSCQTRYTTYERTGASERVVIKSDRSRERFDRIKLRRGIEAAVENLDVSNDAIDQLVEEIVAGLDTDIPVESRDIGQAAEERLLALNPVAFVRFSSVHRRFSSPAQFILAAQNMPKPRLVRKRDGRLQPFDFGRIRTGIRWAVKHTPIDGEAQVTRIADQVVSDVMPGEGEVVPTADIGEAVKLRLRERDAVAYLRFASVFDRFDTVDRFVDAARLFAPP